MALFQELGTQGITIVLVTHEAEVASFASRVVVVKDGKLLSDARQQPKRVDLEPSDSSASTVAPS
jgi:putative ABC transport system ATP-binding protein